MNSGTSWRLGHRPALDGLRGGAILLVLLCHISKFGGSRNMLGTTGVTAFFTLSGFLITSLLVEEHARHGRISLRRFYERRARRLLPALVVLLAVVAVYLAVLGVSAAWVLVPLFYVANWTAAAGHPVPSLGHTWSLSVEEQFYLAWPLVVIALRRHPHVLMAACASGILASNAGRLVLWHHGAGYFRVYYGSDTHADALLVGCLLAVWAHHYGMPRLRATPVAVGLLVAVGSLPAIGWVLLPVMTIVPWLMGAAIVGACNGSRVLSDPVLDWFGRRSYAIYLWHVPLLLFALRITGQPSSHVVAVLVAAAGVLASLVVAEASWRLVEQRWLRQAARTRIISDAVPDEVGARPAGALAGMLPVDTPAAWRRL